MATWGPIEYQDACPEVRTMYDDIMATRKVDWINKKPFFCLLIRHQVAEDAEITHFKLSNKHDVVSGCVIVTILHKHNT